MVVVGIGCRQLWALMFLGHVIRGVSVEEVGRFWNRWMHQYWHQRLVGRPALITPEENRAMVPFIWMLPGREFAEASELLHKASLLRLRDPLSIDLPAARRLANEQPTAVLSVLTKLLSASEQYDAKKDDYLELIRQLPGAAHLLEDWERICHQLSRLGMSWASELLSIGRALFRHN